MYLESLMYLESIKGFEQDAKKFLFMAKDSQDYQFSYKFASKFMRRIIAKKGMNEILKNFELCKKSLKINNCIQGREIEDEKAFEDNLREEFYDGILQDLLRNHKYEISKIVYGERMKETFKFSEKTKLLGLETFASMQMEEQFEEIFN